MKREFTGRDMAIILVVGFGIVIGVNLYMASVALRSFNGVVVENSYLASQKYNGWLEEAERQEAYGWQAELTLDESRRLVVATGGVPARADVVAEIRRPLGEREIQIFALQPVARDQYRAAEALPAGRWIVRVRISSQGKYWVMQEEIQ